MGTSSTARWRLWTVRMMVVLSTDLSVRGCFSQRGALLAAKGIHVLLVAASELTDNPYSVVQP